MSNLKIIFLEGGKEYPDVHRDSDIWEDGSLTPLVEQSEYDYAVKELLDRIVELEDTLELTELDVLFQKGLAKKYKAQVDELKAWGKSLPCPDSCHNGGLYTDLGYGNFDVERCEWCGKRDDALSGKANNIPGLTEGRCACGYYGYISEGMCPDCFVVPSGGAG